MAETAGNKRVLMQHGMKLAPFGQVVFREIGAKMTQPITVGSALIGRDNNFNLLRFLAAFAVLADHVVMVQLGDYAPISAFERYLGIGLSDLAVNIFFFLSGFLIIKSLLTRGNIIDYAVARALRLFPAFAAMVFILTYGIGFVLTSETSGAYLQNWQTHCFWIMTTFTFSEVGVLPGLFSGNALPDLMNGAIWTLKYEILAYGTLLGLWCIGVAQNRNAFAFTCVMFSLILVMLVQTFGTHITPHDVGGDPWVSLLRFGLCFLLGASFYVFREKVPLSGWIVLSGLLLTYAFRDNHLYETISIVSIGYLVLWFSLIPAGKLRVFNKVGDYSYGIYIWHWPVLQVIVAVHPGLSYGELFLAGSSITLALAVLSWHVIEKPALNAHCHVLEYCKRGLRVFRQPLLRTK